MKLKKKSYFLILNFFIIILFIFCKAASADKPFRVLVLPFNIHSEKDLSFLQKGIQDMLSSRLFIEDKVVLISQEETNQAIEDLSEPINEKNAYSLATELQADYVLIGSLTVFGESISTDARFIDVHQKKAVVVFSQIAQSQSDVISHINLFSGLISEKVFGQTAIAYQPPSAPSTPQPSTSKESEGDIRRHPETLWTQEKGTIIASSGSDQSSSSLKTTIWKSRTIPTKIKGLAVGDVDGDGKQETVFISGITVFVYRHDESRFVKVAEITSRRNNIHIGVDIADINKNGKAEIFVTNYNNTDQMNSFVLEWNGTEFVRILDKTNWYYRVLNVTDRGNILLGQKRGSSNEMFASGVYEMTWENGEYIPAQPQNLPNNMNIYGFNYGNVMNDGRELIVAFLRNDKVRILDSNGEEEWRSSEVFGGNTIYLERPLEWDEGDKDAKELLTKRYYLPHRIHVADLDRDGKNEIVLIKNNEVTKRSFQRIRSYSNGQVESLIWNQIGMNLKWKTQKISGYISDFVIGDFNNDGKDELVICNVSNTKLVIGKHKSYIVSWAMKE